MMARIRFKLTSEQLSRWLKNDDIAQNSRDMEIALLLEQYGEEEAMQEARYTEWKRLFRKAIELLTRDLCIRTNNPKRPGEAHLPSAEMIAAARMVVDANKEKE